MQAMADRPFVFASIRAAENPDFSTSKMMLRGFTATLVASILLAILLAAVAPRLNYAGRTGFVVLIALLICTVGLYPNQIWWEFSSGFVLANILDTVRRMGPRRARHGRNDQWEVVSASGKSFLSAD
jgi:uncharacterized membrane protein YhaH (DUF805 family)